MLLHVGCGSTPKPAMFAEYTETRLDISDHCRPDIVADMKDMGEIGQFDVLYSSHSLEHLYPHEVPVAVREFRRVLKDGGHAVIIVPDLEDVAPTEDFLYESEAGPICGLDLYYGMGRLIAEHPFMAHHSGFTQESLASLLEGAGFSCVVTKRLKCYNLMAIAHK